MWEGLQQGLGTALGGIWSVLAPYQGIFWFFVLVLLTLAILAGVAAYYLLLKDSKD